MRSFGMNVVQVVASNMYTLYTFGIWWQCQWSTPAVRTMIWQYLVVLLLLFVVNTLESLDMVCNLKFIASEAWSSLELGLYHVFCSLLVTSTFFFDLIKQAECWQNGDLYKVTQYCSMWVLSQYRWEWICIYYPSTRHVILEVVISKSSRLTKWQKVLVVKSSMKGNLLFHNLSLLFLFQDLVHLWGKACGQILK